MDKKDFYSVDDVADIFGLNPVTIRRMLADGRMPGHRMSQKWRISHEQLNEYLKKTSNEKREDSNK